MPTFGSLFAGIGGFDLGLERAGWECRWQVESDPFCQSVLRRHWPDTPLYGDVHDVDWSEAEGVELVAGGFPCQPFSYAGLRAGTEDDRWLWPEVVRCLRSVRPRFILLENVAALATDAAAFGAVLGDLSLLGFDAEWSVLPACALGAPHARERLFLVAYTPDSHVADHMSSDRRRTPWPGQPRGSRRSARRDGWLPEPAVDRVAYGLPLRMVRDPLHALGNAVLPRIAEEIGAWLLEVA